MTARLTLLHRLASTRMITLCIVVLLFGILNYAGRAHRNYGHHSIMVLQDMFTGQYIVETGNVNPRTQLDVQLIGTLDAYATDQFSGALFDTEATKTLHARYTPWDDATSHFEPATVDLLLSELDQTVRQRFARSAPQSYQSITRSSVPASRRTGPMDDLSTYWSAPPIALRSRSLPSGYAANTMLLLVVGLFLILVIRLKRKTLFLKPLRFAAHECSGCGYDLRGLNSSEPCPECGQQADSALLTADADAL